MDALVIRSGAHSSSPVTDIHDWHETDRLHAEQGQGDPFAAAVRATRMAMIITDPRQADNPIVFANAAFFKLTGFGRDEVLGHNCRFLQGSGDRSRCRRRNPHRDREPKRHRDRPAELSQERRTVLERPLHQPGHERGRRAAILLRLAARRDRQGSRHNSSSLRSRNGWKARSPGARRS